MKDKQLRKAICDLIFGVDGIDGLTPQTIPQEWINDFKSAITKDRQDEISNIIYSKLVEDEKEIKN